MSDKERSRALAEVLDISGLHESTFKNKRLEIIDHHTEEGLVRVRDLARECKISSGIISDKPFKQGEQQLIHHAEFWGRIPIDQAVIEENAIRDLKKLNSDIEETEIRDVIKTGPITRDLAYLVGETRKYQNDPKLIEGNSRFIWDSGRHELTLYLGPNEHRLLQKTRLLGLVPFDAVDKLRTARVVSIGASVAASTLDLLASLGAEEIAFYDSGTLDPADIAKSPASMGGYRSVGRSKADLLMGILRDRNPYGNYLGVPGNILLPGENGGELDISLETAIFGADIVLEVVDSARHKVGVRDYMRLNKPNTPLVYIADAGSSPFAGIEIPGEGNIFNQFLGEIQKDDLRERAGRVNNPIYPLGSIYEMVEKDLPFDHELELLYIALGNIPYLSQTPTSARASSEIAAKLILLYLQGEDIAGRNFHSYDAPTTLIKGFDQKRIDTLKTIMDRIMLPPLDNN